MTRHLLRDVGARPPRPQGALSSLPPIGSRLALHESAHARFARAIRETPPQLDRAALASAYDAWLEGTMATTIRDGVATIPVRGVLFKDWNWYCYYMGGSTYQAIAYDLELALESPHVHAIILAVDSPGGQVDGVEELAALIYAARGGETPIVAHVDGYGASAAYWITSAASRVLAQATAGLGSIGAMMTFVDYTGLNKELGIEEIDIISTQSPKKNADPKTAEGKKLYQVEVDDLAGVFIERAAEYRGTDVETVLAQFGQGDVFIGQRAVDAGLADAISTYDALHRELTEQFGQVMVPVSQLATMRAAALAVPQLASAPAASLSTGKAMTPKPKAATPKPGAATPPANASAEAATDDEDKKDDEEQDTSAEEQEPKKGDEDEDEEEETTASAQAVKSISAIRAEAAAAERDRIKAIRALGGPGSEAVVAQCIDDPDCTVEKAALAILTASKQGKQAHLKKAAADEGEFTPPANTEGGAAAGADQDAQVIARISNTYLEHRRPGAKLANRGGK